MVAIIVALVAALLAGGAELLHARRVRRLAALAFGPSRRARVWTRFAPWITMAAVGALSWGFVTLWQLPPKVHEATQSESNQIRHLLLVLDVSPSMQLQDAGATKTQSRRQRAADLLRSFFTRVSVTQYKISVVAAYNGAIPVVEESQDLEVIQNILNDLPMHFAFRAGETDLFAGLEQAAKMAQPWEPRSTTVVLISDGDTVPATGMPKMPVSVANVMIVGVGDPVTGKFINGRQSRQDSLALRQMAIRLKGHYHDGNTKHIPSTTLKLLTDARGESEFDKLGRREYAMMALAFGGGWYALLPWLLHLLGTGWRPGRRRAPT